MGDKTYLLVTLAFSLCASLVLTPLVRRFAVKKSVLDAPVGGLKEHNAPTPCLGGVSVALAFFAALGIIRYITDFPSGTLHNLRGIFLGGFFLVAAGIADDLKKPAGLSPLAKYILQCVCALIIIGYGISIQFVPSVYIGVILTVIWTTGVINSLNIIDIMDGLCGSVAVIAALGFLVIALPSEQIYVNFGAVALIGALLGFLPYNFSKKYKIFLGDSGSMFVGFVLAALSMGAKYDTLHPLGVYAPLLILAVPVFDTFFVSAMRIKKGLSPFRGSQDHFALRLVKMGLSPKQIVLLTVVAGAIFSLYAFLAVKLPPVWALVIYCLAAVDIALAAFLLSRTDKC